MAAAELRVFLEQAFLQIETEGLGVFIVETRLDLREREFVDDAIGVEHVVERLAFVLRRLRQQFGGPDFVGLETF